MPNDVAPSDMQPERKRSKKAVKLIGEYTRFYGLVGLGITMSGRGPVGMLWVEGAEQRATELIDLASHHPKMLKVLEQIVSGSDYSAFIGGHVMLAYATMTGFGVPTADKWYGAIKQRFATKPKVNVTKSADVYPPESGYWTENTNSGVGPGVFAPPTGFNPANPLGE